MKYLFIDRDGTLVQEPADEQVDSFEKIRYMPGLFTHLGRIARDFNYQLVLVSNQDGLGTSAYPEEDFWPVQNRIMETMEQEGIIFAEALFDRSFEYEGLDTRKPNTGMVKKYMNSPHDMSKSFVIGDRLTDMILARNMGCKGILLDGDRAAGAEQFEKDIALKAKDWSEISAYLFNIEKHAVVERKSRETDIRIEVSLHGSGKSEISTGLGFFDHMLDQLARHSGADINILTKGDLHVDEHHTIEDTALVLGQAFREAWGDLRGMNRYGFVLPMDDCEARVSIDLGGRPYLKWEADFTREKVGEVPSELFPHFFRSFADGARATIHIEASGSNEHHKIEAICKALARSLRQAWSQSGSGDLPTTKEKID